MAIWHPANEAPIENPLCTSEVVSRPILIVKKNGMQVVGTYTYNKGLKRKTPCYEQYTKALSRIIIPNKDVAYWTELPDYPAYFKPHPLRKKRWDGEIYFESNHFLDNTPKGNALNWIPINNLPMVIERKFKWYEDSKEEVIAHCSEPILFLLDNGVQIVGIYAHNTEWDGHYSYFGAISHNIPEFAGSYIYSSAINKQRVKFWALLPEPPEDILISMNKNNFFSKELCHYSI